MAAESKAPLVVRVAPDIDAPGNLPQVIVSKWDVNMKGRTKIEWQRINSCGDFKFVEPFLTDSDAFENIQISDDIIVCDFNPGTGQPNHEYDLVIEMGGSKYDTQPRAGDPDPGKPVIRN